MPNLRHLDHLATARFLTISTYRRQPLLTDDAVRSIVCSGLAGMCTHHAVRLFGYVIMPTHLHLVLLPPDDAKLMKIIKSFKSVRTRAIFSDAALGLRLGTFRVSDTRDGRRFWQLRGYDHNCRTMRAVVEKLVYCHRNPVKAGLVIQATDWPWSSARWYAGVRDSRVPIDPFTDEEAGTLIW